MEPTHHRVIKASTSGKTTFYELEYNNEALRNAACVGVNTEMFYPDKYIFNREEERFYEKLCSQCPVIDACLEWALCHEGQGIWGGTTPTQRKHYREALHWGLSDLTAGNLSA